MRTSALVRFTGGLAATLLGLTLLGVAPSYADEPPLPVVVDDTVSIYPGQSAELNVLTNDSSPSGDDLALCRFPSLDFDGPRIPTVLAVDNGSSGAGEPGDVAIISSPRAHGTHVIDYYVCDHTHLVPAHLTVEVLPVAPVVVHKVAGKPGRLSVTNKNSATIRFWYGDPRAARPDARVAVPAGATRTVPVRRHKIVWIAVIGSGGGKASLL
ncbi:Ig-like domain-containing protein, partial [Nocardioides hankookensis]